MSGLINKKNVLNALAFFGMPLSIPINKISRASDSDIESAWATLCKNPVLFCKIGGDQLWLATDIDEPANRGELYGWEESPSHYCALGCGLEDLCKQIDPKAWRKGVEPDLEEWLDNANDNHIKQVEDFLDDWLNDIDDEDFEVMHNYGGTGPGAATMLFQSDLNLASLLNVQVVNAGNHDYHEFLIAKMTTDIKTANKIAIDHGLPIRFEEP